MITTELPPIDQHFCCRCGKPATTNSIVTWRVWYHCDTCQSIYVLGMLTGSLNAYYRLEDSIR